MNLYQKACDEYGKPKPMLFNTEMTRAVNEDRKTQTRRDPFFFKFLKGYNPEFTGYSLGEYNTGNIESGAVLYSKSRGCWNQVTEVEKPPYVPGDILYVRENWDVTKLYNHRFEMDIGYKADCGLKRIEFDDRERHRKLRKYYDKPGWQPNMFMPKEAARIFLKVTDVRVERIQDIDYSGAIAEGIEETEIFNELLDECSSIGAGTGTLPVQAFADLWEGLYGSKGYDWMDNPWVWVVEFERLGV